MKKIPGRFRRFTLIVILAVLLGACASGKYRKLDMPRTKEINKTNYRIVYIEANELSEYEIQKLNIAGFLFDHTSGGVSPVMGLETDDFKEGEQRGDVAIHIARTMNELGFKTLVGPKDHRPDDADLIIKYTDTWKWRFVWTLDSLVIRFFDAENGRTIVKGWYQNQDTMVKNPEKPVRKTIEKMLSPEPETRIY